MSRRFIRCFSVLLTIILVTQTVGHAFILRRYDTGAISLSTMFHAAFPNAPEATEKEEIQWVKDNYDLTGNNGSSKDSTVVRLAGVWVSPVVALEIGELYQIRDLIKIIVKATPDPKGNYRRSGAKKEPTETYVPSTVNGSPATPKPPSSAKGASQKAPSPTAPGPNPAKRRRESTVKKSAAPSTPIKEEAPQPTRRSTRATKSPPPKSTVSATSLMSAVSPTKPPSSRSSRAVARQKKVETTPAKNTAIDEESDEVEQTTVKNLYEEDVAEQKEMIRGLKEAVEAANAVNSQPDTPSRPKSKGKSKASGGAAKRTRAAQEEEEKLKFDFDKEPEVGERAIATNKRVSRFQLEPETKSLAWGVAAFVFGAGAVYVSFTSPISRV